MKKINEITAKPFYFSNVDTTFKLAIIVSRFNKKVTEKLLDSALKRLKKLNFPEKNITIVKIPGAIELGFTVKQLVLSSKTYAAIICLGAIIRGETDHYDCVCQQVNYAFQKVALDKNIPIPVIFGVLTTSDEALALARSNKGAEAIDAAMEMISVLNQIKEENK